MSVALQSTSTSSTASLMASSTVTRSSSSRSRRNSQDAIFRRTVDVFSEEQILNANWAHFLTGVPVFLRLKFGETRQTTFPLLSSQNFSVFGLLGFDGWAMGHAEGFEAALKVGDGVTSGLEANGDEFRVNGKELKILSGSLHYFRSH